MRVPRVDVHRGRLFCFPGRGTSWRPDTRQYQSLRRARRHGRRPASGGDRLLLLRLLRRHRHRPSRLPAPRDPRRRLHRVPHHHRPHALVRPRMRRRQSATAPSARSAGRTATARTSAASSRRSGPPPATCWTGGCSPAIRPASTWRGHSESGSAPTGNSSFGPRTDWRPRLGEFASVSAASTRGRLR